MKKVKINPYLQYLLKENLGYILLLVGLVLASVAAVYFLLGKLSENQLVIEEGRKEVAELENKQQLIAAATSQNPKRLSEDVRILQGLIPDSEDYFSIVYALDELSKKTGFVINEYTINLAKSSSTKLSIIVAGVGDAETFIKFLKDYNVGGGRLITAEQIELNAKDVDTFKLTLNFYTKKVSEAESANLNYNKALSDFDKIKDKVTFLISPEDVSSDEAYPVKSNPF